MAYDAPTQVEQAGAASTRRTPYQGYSELMEWSRAFTELILYFAARVATVDGISLDDALLTATPLYPNFKLGTAFDASQPAWQEFLAGIHEAADPVGWTHSFYIPHARQYHPHPFGCFEYHYDPATRTAGLHFGNLDTSGLGALSRERRPERMRELRVLFTDLRRQHPEAETVQGGSYPMRGTSWLYNLPAYRVLFPPVYVAIATPTRPGFTLLDVWGQFLNGHWHVRTARLRRSTPRASRPGVRRWDASPPPSSGTKASH